MSWRWSRPHDRRPSSLSIIPKGARHCRPPESALTLLDQHPPGFTKEDGGDKKRNGPGVSRGREDKRY